MSDPAPGQVLRGRYRLEEMLGSGGMGEVWRGEDLQLGRAVAIKVFSAHMLARPDAGARFEREARVGAALGHPNVVHTFDVGQHDGRWFLVMQLVEGETLLAYRLQHRPLSIAQILSIGGQIAEALVATHEIGLVHRDLKPENILVESAGGTTTVRIADFGMAFMTAPVDPRQGRITADSLFGGTPEYMAPEQISGGDIGPPADIYAFGCVLHELATDRTPFDGGGIGRILASHLFAPPPPVGAERSDVPGAFTELVQRMLAKSPEHRPAADAVRRRLATMDPYADSRHGGVVSDRALRMLTAPQPIFAEETGQGRVEVIGALEPDALIAIRAAGISIVDTAGDLRLVLGASLEDVARACAPGTTVIADAIRGDFSRISGLLRLGVADVVLVPSAPSNLVRSLLRMLRKKQEVTP